MDKGKEGGQEKTRRPAKGYAVAILLAAGVFLATAACVLTGPHVLQGYTIRENAPSPKLFKAPREIVNEVATERLRQAAADAVSPMYRSDPEVVEDAQMAVEALFELVSASRSAAAFYATPPPAPEGFTLTRAQMNVLISLSSTDYIAMRGAVSQTLDYIYEYGIKEETRDRYLRMAEDELDKTAIAQDAYRVACAILRDAIKPNLVVDQDTTDALRAEAAANVEPVVLFAGQKIVDDSEIVSPEIYAILDSLGYVTDSLSTKMTTIIGLSAATLLMFLPMCAFVALQRPAMFKNRKELLLLATLLALAVVITRFMVGLPFYFVPIALFATLAAALIDELLAMVFTVFLTLIAALICGADIRFILYFLINGLSAAMFVRFIMSRNRMLSVALFMSALAAATVAAEYFLFDKGYSPAMLNDGLFAVLNALMTVMLALGSMPIWEGAFGVVTAYRLAYLTSPNSPVLRKLITEAPGTYQHSLMVANLAETAAFDVGANHTIARVGAYYHDIGKLNYPRYYSENQMGENPHDHLTPVESVDVIISHVSNGLKLADEYKLPPALRDFIEQHHGSTLVKYFYYKAYQLSLGEMPEPDAFRYPHRKPQSREVAIVMLADTVEAAVRSMMQSIKSFNEIEETIAGLIKEKLEDGQLIDSGLVIKDLDTIGKSFVRVFKGVNHGRVVYPKAPKEDEPVNPDPIDAALGLAYEPGDDAN